MTEGTSLANQSAAKADETDRTVQVAAYSFVLVLGFVLGIVAQRSSADDGLRIPAAIAAVLLGGNALTVIIRFRRPGPPQPSALDDPREAGRATLRGGGPGEPATVVHKPSPAIPLLVIGLAGWVVIASVLYDTADQALRSLSLIAAILMAYHGLRELQGSPPA